MTGYRTTVCEALYRELEEQRAAGDFFEPGTRVSMLDTRACLESVLAMDILTPELIASQAREVIRNAARDGKSFDPLIRMLDDYCADQGIGLKSASQNNT